MSVRRLAEKQPASFAFTPENLSWAKAQIGKYPEGRQQSAVISILWRAQAQCGGWLPQKAIEATADLLGMAKIRVLEIATFYTMFNLAPVGRFHVQLCGTTPCMLRGSEDLKKVCRRMIGEENHVTADGAFSWIEVECLGACVNAPMVQINADYYEDLTPDLLTRIINDLSAGRMPKPGPQIDRINSAPIGGPTTLTDPALFGVKGKPAERGAPSATDDQAKKPGEPANLRDAPMPKPPEGDATDPRRN
jgi:NADH-quinone oxidoreductase subunit E